MQLLPRLPLARWILGTALALACLLSLPQTLRAQTGTAPKWLHKAQVGDVVYFTFASPARLERYDIAGERWLPSVALTNSPTAFAADSTGLSVAYDRAIYTRNLDGTAETALYNAAQGVYGLLHSPGFIVAVSGGGSGASLTTIRRSDRQFVATWSATYAFGTGLAIDPTARRVFGIDNYTSGFSLQSVAFGTSGSWPTGYPGYVDGPTTNYGYNSSAKTHVSPDASTVILGTGHVYDSVSLAYRASLAGAFDDLAYRGEDVTILLRANKLVAYDNTFLEAGSLTLPKTAQGLALSGDTAFAFSADASATSGISVTKVTVSSFSTAEPGTPPNPALLEFMPEKVIAGRDDDLFVYSKTHKTIFRWDAALGAYDGAWVLGGVADQVAYSPTHNRLYAGYASGEIRQIKLDQGATKETPFANLPKGVLSLQAAGSFVFAMDSTGAWGTHWIYSADGSLKSSREWANYSQDYVWSSLQKKLYQFRDGTSPNDLLATPVSDLGVVGNSTDTPYHGNYSFTHPIRLSSDQTGVLTGAGHIFSATSLALIGSLANAITDGVSVNNRWLTIRPNGNDTQLQVWGSGYLFERGLTIPGYPLRISALSDGRLIVLTSSRTITSNSYPYGTVGAGRLVFSYVDLGGEGSVSTGAYVRTQPSSTSATRGKPATFSVTAGGTAPFTYQWRFKGEPIPAADAATFTIPAVKESDAGAYTVTVANTHGSSESAPATLTITPPPAAPVITTQPAGRLAVVGTSFSLSVTATGAGLSYQWYRGAEPVPGATSASLPFTGFTAAAYGDYTVLVSNDGGEVRSAVARITPPPAPEILSDPVDRYALPGGFVTFSVSANLNSATVQWRRNGINLTGMNSTLLNVNVSELSFGDYDAVLSNVSGTVTSKVARLIRARPATILTSPTDASVLRGGDALFGVVADGLPVNFAYQWQRYSVPTARWVNIVNDGIHYDGATTSQLAVLNIGSSFHGLRLRCVIGNGYGAAAESAAATLAVEALPEFPALAFTTQPLSRSAVPGGVAVFVVATNSPVPVSYQWYHDGVLIPGATSASLLLDPVDASSGGNYTVLANNGRDTLMSLPGRLSLPSSTASPTITAPRVAPGVVGGSLSLAVTVTGAPVPEIAWRRGQEIVGEGAELNLDNLSLTDAGAYVATATNSAGAASATILVEVRPPVPGDIDRIDALVGSIFDLNLGGGINLDRLRFHASGLPNGLSLDPETGRLSGVLTGRAGEYRVRLWTQIGKAKSEIVPLVIQVSAFPADLVGTYDTLLLTPGEDNLPWGRLLFRVAADGQFTGTWQSGEASARSMRGRFELPTDEVSALASFRPAGSAVTIRVTLSSINTSYAEVIDADEIVAEGVTLRQRSKSDAEVDHAGSYTIAVGSPDDFPIDSPGGYGSTLTLGSSSGLTETSGFFLSNSSDLQLTGVLDLTTAEPLGALHSTTPKSTFLTTSTWGAKSTRSFEPDPAEAPSATAHGTARVDRRGLLSARLRLADGTPLTLSLPAYDHDGLDGFYRLFARPHAKGPNFFGGWFTLVPSETAPNRYGVPTPGDSAALWWKKSPQTDGRAHPKGFAPLHVPLFMHSWVAPNSAVSLVAMMGGTRFEPILAFSGMDDPLVESLPGTLVLVGPVLRPATDTAPAIAQGWMLKIDPATGVFSGTLRVAPDRADSKRITVKCSGVFIQPPSTSFAPAALGTFTLPAASGRAKTNGAIHLRAQTP